MVSLFVYIFRLKPGAAAAAATFTVCFEVADFGMWFCSLKKYTLVSKGYTHSNYNHVDRQIDGQMDGQLGAEASLLPGGQTQSDRAAQPGEAKL